MHSGTYEQYVQCLGPPSAYGLGIGTSGSGFHDLTQQNSEKGLGHTLILPYLQNFA